MIEESTMTRKAISTKTKEAVLNEYDHRCAVCGGDRPQVHHIDEDHSNNELENLLPLCPNCHLRDQHNPTRKIDIQKLALFRKHKDPAILKPQFDPLYTRQIFLNEVEINDKSTDSLVQKANELIEFVLSLEMGDFYGEKIKELIGDLNRCYALNLFGDSSEFIRQSKIYNKKYRQKLNSNKEEVQKLIVELLRYQVWENV